MLTISERIAETAEHIIDHDAHGYSQPNRDGDGTNEQFKLSDGDTVTVHGGDYDCSELARVCVNCALSGDYRKPINFMWTGNEYEQLTKNGFITTKTRDVKRGDILLRDGHTEVYLGNDICGGARIGDKGLDGIQGDQNGYEVTKGKYDASKWDTAFTYKEQKKATQSEDEMICIIQPDDESRLVYIDGANWHPLAHPDESEAIQKLYRQTHNGADIPMFKFGSKEAPWGKRLRDALNRKGGK